MPGLNSDWNRDWPKWEVEPITATDRRVALERSRHIVPPSKEELVEQAFRFADKPKYKLTIQTPYADFTGRYFHEFVVSLYEKVYLLDGTELMLREPPDW